MKRLFFVLLIALFVSVLLADGTEPTGDPREVSILDHLLWISTNSSSWGDDFIQLEDIDASATSTWNIGDHDNDPGTPDEAMGFSPVGDHSDNRFTGSYDGQNHTIDHLYIYRSFINSIGLFGYIDEVGLVQDLGVTNVYIVANFNVGGLAAKNYGSINNCYTFGSVSGQYCVGGLVGINLDPINNCYATGSVSGNDYVGGLVGWNNKSSTNIGTINSSYATGSVSGNTCVGGLVGYNFNYATINNSYASGSVSGAQGVGGLVGVNRDSSEINKSYSIGSVSGTNFLGGLVGFNYPDATVSNSLWDTETSNQSTSSGGTGKTTAEMKTESTYTDAGWDFTTIWEMIGVNYPRLQDNPDPTLPVTLSSFTVQYLNNSPTLYWETQSETDNMGWFVYRNVEENFTTSEKISEFIEGHGTTTQQQSYIFEDTVENPETGEVYYYWLESIDLGGEITHYNAVATLTIPQTGEPGSNNNQAPELNGMAQNTPNPFNIISSEKTDIQFALSTESKIEISVYNIKGEFVKNIYNEFASEGTASWNGKDENGNKLQAGMYFYKLLVNGKTEEIKKLNLMK